MKVRGRSSRWKGARLSCSLRKSRRETKEQQLPSKEPPSSRKGSALYPCHSRSLEGVALGRSHRGSCPCSVALPEWSLGGDGHAAGEGLGGANAPDSQELERFFG